MGKNFLLEVKSLINRIENTETINETKVGFRFIDKAENLPDLLAGLKPGKMFTFGYVNVAQIVVPTVKRRNPETNRMKSYEDYAQLGKNLGEEGEVVNVIKLSMYNFPWQEQNRVKQRYSDWRTKRDELAGRFGVTYGKARYGTEMNNFGGGIESYKGNNPELSDHTYLNFNLHNIRPFNTTYYLLFDDGTIKQVDEKKLEFKAKNSYDELQKLRDAGATEADLECLIGMNYHKFENSKILFVSGTEMDGVPTLLINDNLSDKISGIAGVNRDAIVQIAKDRYSKVLNVQEGKDIIFNELINENEEFIPQGYKADSNFGGKEIQISNSGDAARIRTNYSGQPDEPSEWMEIQFDDEGVAYVDTTNGIEKLSDYMRY